MPSPRFRKRNRQRLRHAKGHHVLIHPKEELTAKAKAKRAVDMVHFVDEADIDSRYLEEARITSCPDGDEADEGYTVIRDALKRTGEVAARTSRRASPRHSVGVGHSVAGSCSTFLRYADEATRAHILL